MTYADESALQDLDALIIAVMHKEFASLTPEKVAACFHAKHRTKIVADLKGIFNRADYPAPEFDYWRL